MRISARDLSPEQKNELIVAARFAATAVAEFWDVLHDIEEEHETEFNNEMDFLEVFAADTGMPPSPLDIDADQILEALMELQPKDDED